VVKEKKSGQTDIAIGKKKWVNRHLSCFWLFLANFYNPGRVFLFPALIPRRPAFHPAARVARAVKKLVSIYFIPAHLKMAAASKETVFLKSWAGWKDWEHQVRSVHMEECPGVVYGRHPCSTPRPRD